MSSEGVFHAQSCNALSYHSRVGMTQKVQKVERVSICPKEVWHKGEAKPVSIFLASCPSALLEVDDDHVDTLSLKESASSVSRIASLPLQGRSTN